MTGTSKPVAAQSNAPLLAPTAAPRIYAAAPPREETTSSRAVIVQRPLVLDPRAVWLIVGIGIACWFMWTVRDVVVLLVFTAVLTFLGAPIVRGLEKRKVPRAVGAGVFLLILALVVSALLGLVIPPLIDDLIKLFASLPAAATGLLEWIERVSGQKVPTTLAELSGEASRELLTWVTSVAGKSSALVGTSAMGIAAGAMSAASFLGSALLVPILTFFVLAELPALWRVTATLAPRAVLRVTRRYVPLVDDALSGLLRGQAIVAGIMAVIYIIGLLISGVPVAIAIGILSGVAYVVPFASSTVCFVLAALFSAVELKEHALGPIVGAFITCIVVQVVESYILTPKIVGERAGLSPLGAMLAVLIGGNLFGFLGVIFALPVGAVIAIVFHEETRRRSLVQTPGALA